MPLLQNHIAVITGAASGIGRAIAIGYAREGAQVALLDINEKAAGEAAQEIRRAGGQAESFALAATRRAACTGGARAGGGRRAWSARGLRTTAHRRGSGGACTRAAA